LHRWQARKVELAADNQRLQLEEEELGLKLYQ
jgi:hypothetical protein